ncbi:MAG: carbohydrate ABC transporter permease [Spirochaetales bacterium]|nr:carbohydrate ABC transporter permease [Spirochaetales bacterium]
MIKRNRVNTVILGFFIFVILILFLVPIFETIFTSVKADSEIYKIPVTFLPHKLTFMHYDHVFTNLASDFFNFFRNSVVVTSVSVVIILFLGSLASYGLARIDFYGKNIIIFFVSFIVSIPLIITVIPIFMMETTFKIINTNIGLILPYSAVYMPIPLFIMYSSFLKIPTELEESAIIDGCSRFMIYRKIFLPLAVGGLVAAGIITFLNCWGEFLFALILTTKRSATTLSIGIMKINQQEQAWALGPMSAVMVLSTAIPFTLYMIFQRYFVQGLMEGSIKG